VAESLALVADVATKGEEPQDRRNPRRRYLASSTAARTARIMLPSRSWRPLGSCRTADSCRPFLLTAHVRFPVVRGVLDHVYFLEISGLPRRYESREPAVLLEGVLPRPRATAHPALVPYARAAAPHPEVLKAAARFMGHAAPNRKRNVACPRIGFCRQRPSLQDQIPTAHGTGGFRDGCSVTRRQRDYSCAEANAALPPHVFGGRVARLR